MGAKICSTSNNSSLNLKKNKKFEKAEINIGELSVLNKEVINSRRNSKLSNQNGEVLFVDQTDMNKLLQNYKNFYGDQVKWKKEWKDETFQRKKIGFFEEEKKMNKKTIRHLIKNGIPFDKTRQFLEFIFCNDEKNSNDVKYDCILQTIFENNVPLEFKFTPTFSEFQYLEELIQIMAINKEGIDALKRILWLLKQTQVFLSYCPYLVQSVHLLLLFLRESDVYCYLVQLIENSKKLIFIHRVQQTKKSTFNLNWTFSLSETDFSSLCLEFQEILKQKNKKIKRIIQHLYKIKFDFLSLIKDIFIKMFIGYLDFVKMVIRIFLFFLNEGVIVLYRFCYSLLIKSEAFILSINDNSQVFPLLKNHTLNFEAADCEILIKFAFSLKLQKITLMNLETKNSGSEIFNSKSRSFYLPKIEDASVIISKYTFEIVLDWIPELYRGREISKVFSSEKHGFSLANLYRSCEKYIGFPMIILIKTDKESIFGAFSLDMIRLEKHYYGNDETFLFMLKPIEKKFEAKKEKNFHIFSCLEYFSFGADIDGVAFQLDNELNKGITFKSKTYDNLLLTGNEDNNFICLTFELYALK